MENEEKDSTVKPNTNRVFSVYAKQGAFNPSTSLISNGNKEKKTTSSTNHGPSFTQRLIDRGVAVPSSFSTWEKARPSEDSSSPGSYDFDTYYGMSPFITPSFSANDTSHFHQEGPLYKSLRHRYEKEKHGILKGDCIDEEEPTLSSPEFLVNNNTRKKYSAQPKLSTHKEKPNAEDSDIELSDVEEEEGQSLDHRPRSLLPHHSKTRRSRSPLSFPSASESTESLRLNSYHQGLYDELLGRKIKDDEEKVVLSPSTERLKNLLITPPKKRQETNLPIRQPKPLSSPPRKHLLHIPVFQVVNASTVKDRYLFLFNDLLLICKPIMDENIIVGNNPIATAGKERYRFRSNENSLFQVKNIVELSKLTLYISKDDYYASSTKQPTIEIGPDGRPILPPARKIHPIMASALRNFESDAHLGIQYLIDKGTLTNDPLNIANFLFKTPDLNRRQLGYYLADQKNADVYDAYLECFRMVGLRLDEALRILLTTFRLPSLWEALEYIIERFAKKWHDANQNVIKFHEDMVVKVVVATLFLNAELWFDATSEKDVFWYAREVKERQGRQAKRKMSMIDYQRLHQSMTGSKHASTQLKDSNRQSVTIEPLHYIMSLRAKGSSLPTLSEFLERWNYYDQYHLVPREFMEEMFKSIRQERLETGWDNKVDHEVNDSPQDVVITVVPHRLPSRLTRGVPSDPITISIPAPDKGLQIKLRGQDLVFEPSVLDFSHSCVQSFTITGNTYGRTSLMFIKSGENAGNYVSPTLPRTKTMVVERAFMRYTFHIGFKHLPLDSALKNNTDSEQSGSIKTKEEMKGDEEEDRDLRGQMVNRLYTFSVETLEERTRWLDALKKLSGYINGVKNERNVNEYNTSQISSESKVALQVLKEVLLADEVKKGTARAKSRHTMHSTVTSPVSDSSVSFNDNEGSKDNLDDIPTSTPEDRHGRVMKLLLPKRTIDTRSSTLSTGTTAANVVTKRGHEIIQLVVQNSMVPLVLSFLRSYTKDK